MEAAHIRSPLNFSKESHVCVGNLQTLFTLRRQIIATIPNHASSAGATTVPAKSTVSLEHRMFNACYIDDTFFALKA